MTSRVLTTITAEDIQVHRAALCAWAEANRLDLDRVAEDTITVEAVGGRTVICYREIQCDLAGRPLVDPSQPAGALTVRRSVDQRVSLEAADVRLGPAGPEQPAGGAVTQGDGGGAGPGG